MSQRQSEAIRAWWAKRKADGLVLPKDLERRKAKNREYAKGRYARNREAILQRGKDRYEAHREELNAARRRARAENPEAFREAERLRRLANIEKVRAADRQRYASDPTRFLASNKAWRDANRERVRANARRRDALKASTAVGPVDYSLVMQKANGVCGICGESVDMTRPKSYHFDHIVPLARGGGHVQENIQLAHATCNMRKHARVA